MNIFGFQLFQNKKSEQKEEQKIYDNSFVTKNDGGDAAIEITTDYRGGRGADSLDALSAFQLQSDAIDYYRKMAENCEVEPAIDNIIDDAVVLDEKSNSVEVVLEDTEFSANIKKKILEEWKECLRLMQFSSKGKDIFRKWYVDGQFNYHKIVDLKRPALGIKKLKNLDPKNLKLIREVETETEGGIVKAKEIKEYYVYTEQHLKINTNSLDLDSKQQQTFTIQKDSIAHTNSGLIDFDKGLIRSHLHKAIKPLNNLTSVEDALVINGVTRAPQRLAFYVDVGTLPKQKAEEYLSGLMQRYKNSVHYDKNSGEIMTHDDKMGMLDDFWLPRREGGRGTEISTLDGTGNLQIQESVEYFLKKLYKALYVPVSRMESDQATIQFGRQSEITRDELKFSKFITSLRFKFSEIFYDILGTQLILKKVITKEEWLENKDLIRFDFLRDAFIQEQKDDELLAGRLERLEQIKPYVGKHFSYDWINRNVLHFTDEQIEEMEKSMEDEEKKGLYDVEDEF